MIFRSTHPLMMFRCAPIVAVMLALLSSAAAASACDKNASERKSEAKKIEVTVLAILATDQKKDVDRNLKDIAKEVQKKDPTLTGFVIERTAKKSLAIGQSTRIKLVDDVEVSVHLQETEDHRVSITIKPPTLGEITYSCCCGKYFPVVTRYQTKDGSRLIIAVMVKPCSTK